MLPLLLVNAKTSQEQLGAGPESLFMSHHVLAVALSEHAVLMIHEISQTLVYFFFNLYFLHFSSRSPSEQAYSPTVPFVCSWDCSLENANSV